MNKIYNPKLLEEAKAIAEAEAQAAVNAQKQAEQKEVIRKSKKEVEILSTPKRIKNTKAIKKLLKEAKEIAAAEMAMMKKSQAEDESKNK